MYEQQHGSLCDQTSATSTITTASEATTSGEDENEECEAKDLNSQVKNEDLTYFRNKLLANEESPSHFWNANKDNYPTLARLAKCYSYLCIPGTSTPSEWLSSLWSRQHVFQDIVNMLTFLYCNAKFM